MTYTELAFMVIFLVIVVLPIVAYMSYDIGKLKGKMEAKNRILALMKDPFSDQNF